MMFEPTDKPIDVMAIEMTKAMDGANAIAALQRNSPDPRNVGFSGYNMRLLGNKSVLQRNNHGLLKRLRPYRSSRRILANPHASTTTSQIAP